MKLSSRHVLCFVLITGLCGPVSVGAQNASAATMNRIPIQGYNELAKMISDPAMSVTDKRYAVARLGELSKDLAAHKEIPASGLYNPILGVLTPQKNVEGHHVLREEACNVLALFARIDGSGSLVQPLGRVLKNGDEHVDVRVAAARSLGRFQNQSGQAVETLLDALNAEIKAGPNQNNIRMAGATITSLGYLGDKKAFVPLMRVLNSSFPSGTKRQAQAALESLNWKNQ
ncbi:MAG: HEAT repeat domain-containing protein [Leptospiraceae bacterium]|nr:HEAT repeat domain-containing protein [Leptospiraceae bacterium]